MRERITHEPGRVGQRSLATVAYNTDVRERAKRDRIFELVGQQVEVPSVHSDLLVPPHPALHSVQRSVAIRWAFSPAL